MKYTTFLSYDRFDIATIINNAIGQGWEYVNVIPQTENGGHNTSFVIIMRRAN